MLQSFTLMISRRGSGAEPADNNKLLSFSLSRNNVSLKAKDYFNIIDVDFSIFKCCVVELQV